MKDGKRVYRERKEEKEKKHISRIPINNIALPEAMRTLITPDNSQMITFKP